MYLLYINVVLFPCFKSLCRVLLSEQHETDLTFYLLSFQKGLICRFINLPLGKHCMVILCFHSVLNSLSLNHSHILHKVSPCWPSAADLQSSRRICIIRVVRNKSFSGTTSLFTRHSLGCRRYTYAQNVLLMDEKCKRINLTVTI